MKRTFHAVASAQTVGSGLIYGLALPYGVEASPYHPAFPSGILVADDLPKPLFLEHRHERVGTVERIWEKPDGVYFLATVDDTELLAAGDWGLSVGGEYEYEGEEIKSLYIYEISLTKTPAYTKTYMQILANMHNKLKAQQDVEALASLYEELSARVSALEGEVGAMKEQLAALEQALQNTQMSVDSARNEAQQLAANAQAQLSAVASQLESSIADKLLSVTETIRKILAK